LFAHQAGEASGAFSAAHLKAFAATLKLDTAQFNACFDSHRYAQAVKQDEALANSLSVHQTPTVLVNGVLVNRPLDTTELRQIIDVALTKTK
jgi:protein-disulfide isomerase